MSSYTMTFFNQPITEITCGWRCLSLILEIDYETLLNEYSGLNPFKNGLYWIDIIRILDKYGIKWKHSIPREEGFYFILLYLPYPHYIIYQNGEIYNSLEKGPFRASLLELQKYIESGTSNDMTFIIRIEK